MSMEGSHHKKNVTSTLPEFPNCFVCGQKNPRGLKVQFNLEGKEARACFVPDETLAGYKNRVHGGIISALLDEALIWASFASTRQFGMTAELTVRFKKPLLSGTSCKITGYLTDHTKRVWSAEAKIEDQNGNMLAKAQGKIIPMSTDDEKV